MIKKIKLYIVILCLIFFNVNIVNSAVLDPSIPAPTSVSLSSSGDVFWDAPNTTIYKSFQIRLIKRYDTNKGGMIVYEYKDIGSIKTVDGDERNGDVTFGSVGYYRVKVRAVNLSGNYSNWKESDYDVPVTKDDTGGGGSSGGGNHYGPGYNNNTNNGGYGPGYNYNNNSNIIGPGTNNYNNNSNIIGPGTNNYNNNYNSLEVGWHQDSNGRYYYQGNGRYYANTWVEIGGYYYRFNQNGYVYTNTFFLESSNNNYYLLGSDGRMLTGWQKVNNKWYYMNPNRDANYGIVYINSIINDQGKIYALSNDGSMVMNAWYNGSYYGADGSKQ